MIISLTGFMGCGKSSVGRKLSELLLCNYADLDTVIENSQGKTIAEIFESDGEAAFRRMELDALNRLLATPITVMSSTPKTVISSEVETSPSLILSLGGGTIMTPECAGLIREKTLCIYLRATIDTLVENLTWNDTPDAPNNESTAAELAKRPMLSGIQISALRQRITDLMAKRSATYENTAHIIIDTDGKFPLSLATEIINTVTQISEHLVCDAFR